jgi:hypothetical protein
MRIPIAHRHQRQPQIHKQEQPKARNVTIPGTDHHQHTDQPENQQNLPPHTGRTLHAWELGRVTGKTYRAATGSGGYRFVRRALVGDGRGAGARMAGPASQPPARSRTRPWRMRRERRADVIAELWGHAVGPGAFWGNGCNAFREGGQ